MQSDARSSPGSPTGTDKAAALVHALRDPACYPHDTGPIELIETHISWVLLTGQYAYKIKKPLKLPFLDFSTLERRLHFCQEELRLNRRLAEELYLDVVPIGGSTDAPRVGQPPAIEYAVKLEQFDPGATADRMLEAGKLDRAVVERLAQRVARFHLGIPTAEGRPPDRLALENLDELESALETAGLAEPLDPLREHTRHAAAKHAAAFDERRRSGAVREGHGDLHLENLVLLDGELRAFDALEFDPTMRSVDVMDEAAFLTMDFAAHGRVDLAHVFLNGYLEITGDYAGTRLLPFYVVYRALVRAKVRAIKAAQSRRGEDAAARVKPYLELARALLRERTPRLILTHGLSASGKSTVTDELIPRIPAIRLRSDLERKRLHGVAPDAHDDLAVGAGRYSAEATEHTYARLAELAEHALSAGLHVIVDATFLGRGRRRAFESIAARCGARYTILACEAAEQVLRERVRERAAARSDASEATEAVLDAQLRGAEPFTAAEEAHVRRVDTSRPTDYDALAATLSGS